jgi:hypothetical protein
MIEDARGQIDYHEQGSGPTILLVPAGRSNSKPSTSPEPSEKNRYECLATRVSRTSVQFHDKGRTLADRCAYRPDLS